MVKLIGPALGQAASGSLAGALTFSNSKGRAYVKTFKKPKQPHSKPQMAMRAAMAFLSQQWGLISTPYRDTWNDLATYGNVSPFNAFQGENLTRLRNFKAPTIAYPAAETGAGALWGGFTATGGVRAIDIEIITPDPRNNWGWPIFQVAGTGVQPIWSDLIHILPSPSASTFNFQWTQHNPGTYWFTYLGGTTTGKRGNTADIWRSAVITG